MPDPTPDPQPPAPRRWIKVTFDPHYSGYVLDVLFTDGVGRIEVRDEADLAAKLRRAAGLRNIGFVPQVVTEE